MAKVLGNLEIDNGNLGVNTSTPLKSIQVGGGSTSEVVRVYYSDASYIDITGFGLEMGRATSYIRPTSDKNKDIYLGSDGRTWNTISHNANITSFSTDTTEHMRINSSGNVGINTTNPAEKLDVNGQGAFSRNYVYGQSNYHIALNEDTETAYIGNVNGSPYISNASYYGSQIYNVTSTQTGIASVYAQSTGDILFLTSTFTAGAASTQQANTRMTIKGNGNVGIGTTNPDEKLHIVGDLKIDSDLPRIYLSDSSHNPDYSIGNVNGSFFVFDETNSAYRLYVSSAGNVGIGTSLPAANLHVSGGTTILGQNKIDGSSDNLKIMSDYANVSGNSTIEFSIDNSEKMRLENDGDLHVDGDVIAYSTTVSDERLKDNIKTIDNACDKVCSLRGVEYTWNSGSRKGQREIGVIAQEVEKVIPEIVREKKLSLVDDEVYKTVDYEKLVAVLIEANKELCDRVSKLENKLDGITE